MDESNQNETFHMKIILVYAFGIYFDFIMRCIQKGSFQWQDKGLIGFKVYPFYGDFRNV